MKKIGISLLLAALCLAASLPVNAALVTWDAGGGAGNTAWNYNAGTFINWSDDLTPTGDDVTFTATGAVSGTTTVTSSLNTGYSINSLTIRDTTANYQNFDLGGFTLTVANGITIGDADTTTGGDTNVTMKNGTLTQSAGTFTVGPNHTGSTTRTHTLDLRNLTAVNLTTTTIAIGSGNAADNQYNRGNLYLSSGTNTLAATNTYVASDSVGDGRSSNGNLYLSGSTALKSDNIYVGMAYGGVTGQISFASGGTPKVNIRNKAGTGNVGTFVIGDRGYAGTSTTMTGSVDLSGGTADAKITNLRLADNSVHADRTGIANGTLILGSAGDTTSIMDVTTAYLAADPGTGVQYVGTSNATLDIRGGTFRFDTMNVGADRGVYFSSNAVLKLQGGTFAAINGTLNAVSNLANLQIGGVGTVTFGQTSVGTGGLTLTSSTITLGSASTTVVVNVATTLSGSIASTSNALTLNGGSNLLTLAGTTANLNTGLVTVTTGELHLNKTAGVNAIGGNLTVNGGGVVLDAANQLSNSGTVTVSAGQFSVGTLTETVGAFNMSGGLLSGSSTGTLTAATYGLTGGTVNAKLGAGAITVNTATVALGSAARLNSASTLSLQGGQLTLAGAESVASYQQTGGTLAGTGHTLTSASAFDLRTGTVNASLGGAVGVNKTTSGTVALNGTNGYTGNTVIGGGALVLGAAGNIVNSPVVDVQSGATFNVTAVSGGYTVPTGQTLKGSGTLLGGLSIGSGTLAPGSSIGTLTHTGTLSLSGSSTFALEINTTSVTADRVNVSGDLNITAGAALSIDDLGANAPLAINTVLTIIDYAGTWNNIAFSGYTNGSSFLLGANEFEIHYGYDLGAGDLGVALLVVPEPSAALSLLCGTGMLALFRRRRA